MPVTMNKAIGALAAAIVFATLLIGPLLMAMNAADDHAGPSCLRDFSCDNRAR